MEPLTEMHLLLREHGWEPEIERDNGPSYWEWKSIRVVPSVAARTHRRRVRAVPCSRKLARASRVEDVYVSAPCCLVRIVAFG